MCLKDGQVVDTVRGGACPLQVATDEIWKVPPVSHTFPLLIRYLVMLDVGCGLQEEEKKRRDFRKDCVLSIDPSTARVSVLLLVFLCT